VDYLEFVVRADINERLSMCCGASEVDMCPDRCNQCYENTGWEMLCNKCYDPCLRDDEPIGDTFVAYDTEGLVYHGLCAETVMGGS
jgi:hypothetical protein